MDADTALSTIRRENDLLRSQLELLLKQKRNKIPGFTAAIASWREKPYVKRGKPRQIDRRLDDPSRRNERIVQPPDYTGSGVKLRPELHQALIELNDWVLSANDEMDRHADSRFETSFEVLKWLLRNRPPERGFVGWQSIEPQWQRLARDIKEVVQSNFRFSPAAIESHIESIHWTIQICEEKLAEYQVPEQVLLIPEIIHPRHGRLLDGKVARVLVEDLTNILHAGLALEAELESGTAHPVDAVVWCNTAMDTVLAGLTGGIDSGFWHVIGGAYKCDIPAIAHPTLLSQAHLTLGLYFIEEVLDRMPEYAEASGQATPKQHINITGNTIYGGQFAAQLTNINSSIAGIAQSGSQEMVDALKALEQAVLSQAGLDDKHRQELLDNVADLADAANTAPENRRRGRIKSALAALTASAAAAGEVGQAVGAWEPVLNQLLP